MGRTPGSKMALEANTAKTETGIDPGTRTQIAEGENQLSLRTCLLAVTRAPNLMSHTK